MNCGSNDGPLSHASNSSRTTSVLGVPRVVLVRHVASYCLDAFLLDGLAGGWMERGAARASEEEAAGRRLPRSSPLSAASSSLSSHLFSVLLLALHS